MKLLLKCSFLFMLFLCATVRGILMPIYSCCRFGNVRIKIPVTSFILKMYLLVWSFILTEKCWLRAKRNGIQMTEFGSKNVELNNFCSSPDIVWTVKWSRWEREREEDNNRYLRSKSSRSLVKPRRIQEDNIKNRPHSSEMGKRVSDWTGLGDYKYINKLLSSIIEQNFLN